MSNQHNLFYFIGLPGSGKSHALQLVNGKPNIVGVDMDAHIQFKENKSIQEIVAEKGWDYFREVEKEVLQSLTQQYIETTAQYKIIACGGGTPCFHNNIDFMKANGTVIWFNTAIETIAERLLQSENVRPMIDDKAKNQLSDFLTNLLIERGPFYQKATINVENGFATEVELIEFLKQYATK
jgi:shikimate kinase